MQDGDLPATDEQSLSGLLLEAPGGNTEKNNADLFIKRRPADFSLSLPVAAQALLTLQTNAPGGGQGHRTSLRGGGPVTMLLWPDRLGIRQIALWEKLWLNTQILDGDEPRMDLVFPWLAPCLTSENEKDVRTQIDGRQPSPLELDLLCYFATPRRIQLQFAEAVTCSFSGEIGPGATGYQTRNLGANYISDRFSHPLSPYYQGKDGNWLPLHVRGLGFTYADWLATTGTTGADSKLKRPAVLNLKRVGEELIPLLGSNAIWAFGFAMDNMKCLAWHEARFPLLDLPDQQQRERVLMQVQLWTDGVEFTRKALSQALRKAWTYEGKSGDTSTAERSLYARTESTFYGLLSRCSRLSGDDAALAEAHRELRHEWLRKLRQVALALYSEHAERGDVAEQSLQTIERSATAFARLRTELNNGLARQLQLQQSRPATRQKKEAA
jgi:CRISPR system Cascade subunit CasA